MQPEGSDPWRALAHIVRPWIWRYAGLSIALLAVAVPTVAMPYLLSRIVDDALGGAGGEAVPRIRTLGYVFLGLAVVTQLLRMFATWLATVTAWATANKLRVSLNNQVLSLDHEFHRSHTPGELVQRIDGDVTRVSDFLQDVVTIVGTGILMLAGVLAVLLAVDWRIGLGAVLYVGAIMVMISLLRNRAVGEAEESMSVKARLYGGIEERLTAAEDLRGNGAGSHAISRFVEDADRRVTVEVTEERAFLGMWSWLNIFVGIGVALSISVGGYMAASGAATVGTALLMFQYVLLLSRPLHDVIDQLELVQKASGAMVRVDKLMAMSPQIVDHGTTSPPPGPLSISFDRVSFHYGDNEAVVDDVSLTIAPGRSVGVVGRTGSGKTTLSRLVLRLIESTGGELRLGGVPIADIPLRELRRRVAMVPQEVQLLRGTVRDNITLFTPTYDDDQVRAALDAVGLNLNLDDRVGEDIGLSAGESQLLALSRVWLRQPDLVVLDEATARVDPETEADLQVAIAALLEGRTALIIAHRLSTLAHVDEIVVVDHGRVLEHGDRAELESDPTGRYRNLLTLALENGEGGESEGEGEGELALTGTDELERS